MPEESALRFLADMGISSRVASWLRDRGYDVAHLRDEGLQRLPDRDIFKKAAAEGRTVISHTAQTAPSSRDAGSCRPFPHAAD